MQKHEAIETIKQYVFKISTPYGSGTGFQILNSPLWGVATAYHVVAHAAEWGETIKINHYATSSQLVLKENERVIIPYIDRDLAIIVITKTLNAEERAKFPQSDPTLIDPAHHMKQGAEIAWCGFPAVAPNELCFFAGDVSAHLSKEDSYLVDGVAINGVSGGPVFYIEGDVKICGVISAYMPNRATSEILPGLSIVRAVEPYQEILQNLRSVAAAQKKAEEEKQAQQEKVENAESLPQESKQPETGI